jgi:hypothetical protein
MSNPSVSLSNRRTLLRAGIAGAGFVGVGSALSSPLLARRTTEAAAGAQTVFICPVSLNAVYNGVYYYAAMTCDANHTGSTMTSSSMLRPLGCTSNHTPCHQEFFPVGTRETARHHVQLDNGGKVYKAFKKVPLDEPFLVAEGDGTLIGTHQDYRISVNGSYRYVRVFMVFCTPRGGTAAEPRPPSLMGVGQELDTMPTIFDIGADLQVDNPDGNIVHILRKSDLVDFFVIIN